ncbi:XRE family transcriptional regulator [Mycobacterium sp.]|uniref:XRE family transcriptional regulator n=1 Tax=Mycobacterium sp. TaxID=1785 RepID=UPI002CDBFBB4|nr:XRE family transcriptional regulator [Mycobacterium sp.]HME50275.1 XRE family transcriptional regulator [Mycobacterium sp.]
MAQAHPDEGEAPIIVSLAEAAMHMYVSAIDSLPHHEDLEFPRRVEVILSGLRKLQVSLTEAAGRSRTTPAVIVALSEVRRQYDDLMGRAAAAPGSTLGQRLYVARRRARISAQEAANGVGLRADLLDDLEAGEIPTEDEAVKVKQLIEALGGSPEMAAAAFHHRPDPETLDESMAWNGSDVG